MDLLGSVRRGKHVRLSQASTCAKFNLSIFEKNKTSKVAVSVEIVHRRHEVMFPYFPMLNVSYMSVSLCFHCENTE